MFWRKNTTEQVERNKKDFALGQSIYSYKQRKKLKFDLLDRLTLNQRLDKTHLKKVKHY